LPQVIAEAMKVLEKRRLNDEKVEAIVKILDRPLQEKHDPSIDVGNLINRYSEVY